MAHRGGLALAILLLAVTIACAGDIQGSATEAQQSPSPPPAPPAAPKVLAIRTTEPLAAILQEDLLRWAGQRFSGIRFEVGPEAQGDAVVVLETLPASAGTAALAKGLPVEVSAETLVLGGTRYSQPG
ncbi:MAG: hypothetical protein ACLGI9_22480, partial [Thermoanaerobaculia bacterium]